MSRPSSVFLSQGLRSRPNNAATQHSPCPSLLKAVAPGRLSNSTRSTTRHLQADGSSRRRSDDQASSAPTAGVHTEPPKNKMLAEWAGGISPPASHRSGRDRLRSSGSYHPSKAVAFGRTRRAPPSKPVGPGGAVGWPAPLAPRALPRFNATTAQSAPCRCIGTVGLAGPPLGPFPLASPVRFSRSGQKPR